MKADAYLRIVSLRNGLLRPVEFRLRPGERGLSMFARVEHPGPDEIVAAVRAAGKQGDLATASIPTSVLNELGLRLVSTLGGTGNSSANQIHCEARLPFWRELLLRLRGIPVEGYFNERFSERLASAAQLPERER